MMKLKLQKYMTIAKETPLYAIATLLNSIKKLDDILLIQNSDVIVKLLKLLVVDEERGISIQDKTPTKMC